MTKPRRLLTWNAHAGHRGRARRQAEALAASGADLVVLQEVIEGHSHGDILARHWPHATFAPARRRGRGRQGILLLSQRAIETVGHWDFSTNPLERRVALCVKVTGIYVVVFHLNLTGVGRTRQLLRLDRFILDAIPPDAPLMLAGDSNDWSGSLDRRLVRRGFHEAHRVCHGRTARTFPARLPVLPLDRVYGRGIQFSRAWRLSGKPWHALSDHLPLVAEWSHGK